MSQIVRPLVAVIKEQPDYERDLAKKPLTDQEIRDHVPEVWKERARVAQSAHILIPIKGSDHYV